MKINKKDFYLKLLTNITSYSNLGDAVFETLKQMKINEKEFEKLQKELLPMGIKTLMLEINEILNIKLQKEKKPLNFSKFRINEKIKYFVLKRLELFDQIVDKKKFFKNTLRPSYFINSNKILYKISDEIWFLSGDKSTDYNFYTKRLILMKIYALTFTFFVFDNSTNLEDTKRFLEKQIGLVLKFGKIKQTIKSKFNL